MRFCYAHRNFALYPQLLSYRDLKPEDYTPKFLSKVKQLGFDSLEVGVEVLERAGNDKSGVTQFSNKLADFELKVGAVRSGGSLIDARIARNNRERLLKAVDLAAWSGAQVVNGSISAPARYPGHPPGSLPASSSGWPISQDSSRDARLWTFESLSRIYRKASEKAATAGVEISLEVHQNSPVDNSWSALMIHEMVDHPNFGINPDLGNILWNYDVPEESAEDTIRTLAPISNYWHCKNLVRVYHPENNRSVFIRVPLQDGEIDYRFAVAALADAGYSGYMAIEGAWGGDQWYADSQSIDYAKKLWAEVER